MEKPVEAPVPENERDRLNNLIAVSVALLSVFMAVTKVKDDNIVQAMLQAKSDAVDTWSEYQSKRIKQHLLELGRDQAEVFQSNASGQAAAKLQEQVRYYAGELRRHEKEESELRDKAKSLEAQYDKLNFRDDQFDLSDAALSVGLGILAVSALTHKRWLLTAAWIMAGFGVLMGVAGLCDWNLHPGWLVRLLS